VVLRFASEFGLGRLVLAIPERESCLDNTGQDQEKQKDEPCHGDNKAEIDKDEEGNPKR
jgi:hypothetical protein